MSPSPHQRIHDKIDSGEKIVVVDLFCGAGGLSWGVANTLEEIAAEHDRKIDEIIELHAVNHWDRAIETHQKNHPWAEHYNKPIQALNPADVVDLGRPIHLLIAAPDCTHFSPARGGGPKDRASRMTPREVLDWVERLNVRNILFENVPEFQDWGPLDEDDRVIHERKGEFFDSWINQLTIEGFNVEHRILNTANYGDPTSRRRFFLIGRKDSGVEWPEQTHSENGEAPDTEPWRTAADIIDWSDPGESLWIRDLNDGRRNPLVNNTLQRIAEGIRRHCDETLEPFADVLDDIGRENEDPPVKYPLPKLRERIIPAEYAHLAAEILDEPFLVSHSSDIANDAESEFHKLTTDGGQQKSSYILSQHSTGKPRNIREEPLPTILSTSRGMSLCNPQTFLLRQHNGDGAHPLDVTESPTPTIAAAGAISRVDAHPFVLPKNGKQRGLFSNRSYKPDSQPLHTVIANDTRQGYYIEPLLMRYSHGGKLFTGDQPLPTITTAKGGVYSLAIPEPYMIPFYSERTDQRPRTHDISNPHPTIPATKTPTGLCSPFLIEYYGNSHSQTIDGPVPTVTAKDSFGLVIPEMYPLGLDIKFRMLKPEELARAQSFPDDHEFAGNKTETIKQIGNAVPVRTATALCERALIGSQPTIDFYNDPQTAQSEAGD